MCLQMYVGKWLRAAKVLLQIKWRCFLNSFHVMGLQRLCAGLKFQTDIALCRKLGWELLGLDMVCVCNITRLFVKCFTCCLRLQFDLQLPTLSLVERAELCFLEIWRTFTLPKAGSSVVMLLFFFPLNYLPFGPVPVECFSLCLPQMFLCLLATMKSLNILAFLTGIFWREHFIYLCIYIMLFPLYRKFEKPHLNFKTACLANLTPGRNTFQILFI